MEATECECCWNSHQSAAYTPFVYDPLTGYVKIYNRVLSIPKFIGFHPEYYKQLGSLKFAPAKQHLLFDKTENLLCHFRGTAGIVAVKHFRKHVLSHWDRDGSEY